MEQSQFTLITIALVVGLFLTLLACLELGRRLGVRRFEKHGDAAKAGVSGVEAAISALLALLIGFSFSGAGGRFDKRRDIIIQEVGAISTAWERIDVLPAASQPALRAGFRSYLDDLLIAYESPPGTARELQARERARRTRADIWANALVAAPPGDQTRMLVLPTFSAMFDIVDAERMGQRVHQPIAIFIMLIMTAMASAIIAGYGLASGKTRNWLFMIGAAATISTVAYIIIELESPRYGLIRVNGTNAELIALRETMN